MRRRSRAGGEPAKLRHRKAVALKRRITTKPVRGRSSSATSQKTEAIQLARERDEALEQLSAASEVLKVISSSPGDLKPVFEAILENATRICDAKFGTLWLREGDGVRAVALHGAPPAWAEKFGSLYRPGPNAPMTRVLDRHEIVHVPDVRATPAYVGGDPIVVDTADLAGVRTLLSVPMLRGDELIGVIAIYRKEVLPFTDKQIALVENFAAQAVIAIENTRLLNELRQSLEQQTATADVLRVISSSPGELAPVFNAMLENATRICEAKFGTLFRFDGNAFHLAAQFGTPPELVEFQRQRGSFQPGGGTPLDWMLRTKDVVRVADASAEPVLGAPAKFGGARSAIDVPMLKDNELVGAFAIYRQEVRPFTDKQVELLTNFAAQAVIAIENTRLLNELRQRTDDLTESLEQQTATSEVLQVISGSAGELQPVFDAMLENAVRICGAKFGFMNRHDGDTWKIAAVHGAEPAYTEYLQQRGYKRPGPETVVARIASTKQVVHIADLTASRGYAERDPVVVAAVELGGVRTLLGVPMLKEDELIGAILLYRQEVCPFSDKQIALVQNFAAQAVIAIENTRLLNELRQRTDDLTESLEQQTATSEVLTVISKSPGELKPVFETMLANATNICGAKFGTLYLCEGDGFRAAATHNAPPAYAQARASVVHPHRDSGLWRAAKTRQVAQVEDTTKLPGYVEGDPFLVTAVELGGYRTALSVPMLKEDQLIGVISIYRQDVQPFTDKQIELVKNFAAQAVIAIENTRLLRELRQSLEQQTATADVLKVISRSTFDLQIVFDTLVQSAAKLCEAECAFIFQLKDECYHLAASHGFTREYENFIRQNPIARGRPGTLVGRVTLEGRTVHIPDAATDPNYTWSESKKLGGFRTMLGVPLLREGIPIGVMAMTRSTVRPFADKQIELVTTFADQAVIAIENARLLNELRQSLEQQTATADVLKVISRSAFDLQTVLQTLVESAARFCNADKATIVREKDGLFYNAEAYGYSRAFLDYIRSTPIKAERGSAAGRALVEGRVVHIADVKADPEYTFVEAPRLGDFRTALCVPMLREGIPIGVLALTRSEVQPFTDKQIELVTTFADQASIAIENVRLFDEIQDKSRQLEEASQHKSQFLANMSHELRTPLNAILGYTELMADGAYGNPSEKMLEVLKRLGANGKHLLGLINDVLDLSKIEAGQLVLELTDYSIQDIAQTVRSTLEPLAADKKLAFKVEVPAKLPPGHGDGRRLAQVLINLVGNAIKFTDAGEVAIKAEANNGTFYVAVRDTGPGISAGDQAKLFQEFQQADNAITKKKGGTGLGLAISKRIIEMHGGRIWVESQPGQGSTFAFTLPVMVEQQVGTA